MAGWSKGSLSVASWFGSRFQPNLPRPVKLRLFSVANTCPGNNTEQDSSKLKDPLRTKGGNYCGVVCALPPAFPPASSSDELPFTFLLGPNPSPLNSVTKSCTHRARARTRSIASAARRADRRRPRRAPAAPRCAGSRSPATERDTECHRDDVLS